MSADINPKKKLPRGKARFEIDGSGESLAIHVDRKGFHRLLVTLERLAETGEHQVFEMSGRRRSKARRAPAEGARSPSKLVFHIDSP